MKIICTTPIDHLSGLKTELKKFGELIYKPHIKVKELKKILSNKNIDSIFCNPNRQGYVLDKYVLKESKVKFINTASTGTNHINLKDCDDLGINVYSLKSDLKILNDLPSTSDLAFGLMINLIRNINSSFCSVKRYKWDYLPFIGREIKSLKIGIIGYGRLGKFMASYSKAFGMRVFINDPYIKQNEYEQLNLNQICKKVDVISLHVHANSSTKYLINREIINEFKNKPIIINTSRGEIVKESDIIYGLKRGLISGYACDVLEDEFTDIKKSLIIKYALKNDNVLITPHIGGMSIEGQYRAWKFAINKFKKIKKELKY